MRRFRLLGCWLATALFAAAPAQVAPTVAGHVRVVDGVRILFLRGDDRERGFAEGYLMAAELAKLFRGFALSDRIVPQPGWWNVVVVPGVRRRVTVPDWVRERCEGILAGIAARDDALLEIPELHRELGVDDFVALAALPDFAGLACSSFAAWGERTAGDAVLVGRNLDYFATPELLEETMILVHAPRPGRHGWVSIGWPGFAGCLTGFSAAGVTVALHDVSAKARRGVKATPRVVALAELVERLTPGPAVGARAAELLRGFAFGMGGNAMVAWRGGEGSGPGAVVLELDARRDRTGGITARAPTAGPFIACSNHHRSRAEPRECWRYEALYDGLSAGGAALAPGAGWSLLDEARVDGTLYQSLCDLHRGVLRVAVRRVPREDRWEAAAGLLVAELVDEAARGRPRQGR